jgi:hypothetical protein
MKDVFIKLTLSPISIATQPRVQNNNKDIVAYLFKVRTVEPEKQPLLAKGSETTFVSRQRFSKHVPEVTDTHATLEVLLETAFSIRSVQRCYKEENRDNRFSSVREPVKRRLQLGSWRISTVKSRRQGTAGDNSRLEKAERLLWWFMNCGD